jgi:hypothetical protein
MNVHYLIDLFAVCSLQFALMQYKIEKYKIEKKIIKNKRKF